MTKDLAELKMELDLCEICVQATNHGCLKCCAKKIRKETLAHLRERMEMGCGFVIPVVENKVLVKTILCGRDEFCPSCTYWREELTALIDSPQAKDVAALKRRAELGEKSSFTCTDKTADVREG